MLKNYVYYFAYGSNMDVKQMERRCGKNKVRLVDKAYLKEYRSIYDGYSEYRKGSVANIIKSDVDIVCGVVYQIEEDCIKKLDKYEGYFRISQAGG